MAKALFTGFEQAYIDNGSPKLQIGVIYGGVDVPGTYQKKGIIVDLSSVTLATDIKPLITAAIRTAAINSGYTVAALSVFLPDYVAA